jgi:hypothetical protein
MAFPATAMAALKYLKDGAPSKPALYRLALDDGGIEDGCPGVVTWTTQPAGDALSDMVRTCAHWLELVHSGLTGLHLLSDLRLDAREVDAEEVRPLVDPWSPRA